MTPLARLLALRIQATGPMSLHDYMAECLLHPEHGYYTTRDPFGRVGDFITAPEISQIFGEICGLALAQAWLDQGAPASVTLAEAGPGRGTLMADVCRVMARVPGLTPAAEITLIEASAPLRAAQRQRLGTVTHLGSVAEIPHKPLLFLANEFFDALPIRQLERVPGGWAERVVTLDGDRLVPRLAPPVSPPFEAPEGTVREFCLAASPIVTEVAQRIAAFGGAALIVDYGGWNGTGDTFQAVRGHVPVDPFAEPGLADLTAHVDFAPLAVAAKAAGCAVGRLRTQGEWLLDLGAGARAERLAERDPGAMAALRRLTDPSEMGQLFKVLALWPQGAPPVPGFEALGDADHA